MAIIIMILKNSNGHWSNKNYPFLNFMLFLSIILNFISKPIVIDFIDFLVPISMPSAKSIKYLLENPYFYQQTNSL